MQLLLPQLSNIHHNIMDDAVINKQYYFYHEFYEQKVTVHDTKILKQRAILLNQICTCTFYFKNNSNLLHAYTLVHNSAHKVNVFEVQSTPMHVYYTFRST